MASVSREIVIESRPEEVWDVIRDFGSGPSRMAPGLVIDTRVEEDCRIVTFATGVVVRERFVSVDETARRIVYSIIGESLQPTHDNASMQVFADGEGRSRFVWIHDVLPDDLAAPLDSAMAQGLAVIKQTFESS